MKEINWKPIAAMESCGRFRHCNPTGLYYLAKMNEAMEDIRDSMIDGGLYLEDSDGGKIGMLKQKLQKLCPSPEKMKGFFLGIGKKIDSKIQNSRSEDLKKAWNSLKEMALAQDNEEVTPEEAGLEEQVNEGFLDRAKEYWRSLATPDKPARSSGRKSTGNGGNGARTAAKRPSARTTSGRQSAGRGTGRNSARTASARTTTPSRTASARRTVPAKSRASRSAKKAGKKLTVKETILKFFREHWKQITIVLLAALAVGFLGYSIGSHVVSADAVSDASKSLTNFRMPAGMKVLPKGAKLIGNGIVKYRNGSVLASPDFIVNDDF